MPNVPEFFQVIKFIWGSMYEKTNCPMVREHLQAWDCNQPDINKSRRGRSVDYWM